MKKPPRKEVTSLRLEPKVKYLAELTARSQRRTLTNLIECELEKLASELGLFPDLWAIEKADRLVKLGFERADLLTHDELRIFNAILENPDLWISSAPDYKAIRLFYKEIK